MMGDEDLPPVEFSERWSRAVEYACISVVVLLLEFVGITLLAGIIHIGRHILGQF